MIGYRRNQSREYGDNGSRIIRHKSFIESGISVNQIDTILPITQTPASHENSINLSTSKNTKDSTIILSTYDYDYYRNKLIEDNLKKQYGNNQTPGNIVLNSLHLNTIDSKTGLKLGEKYSHGLFDFIEEYKDSQGNFKIQYYDPLKHFLRKGQEKPLTIDSSTDTNESVSINEKIPQVINVISERKNTPRALTRNKTSLEKPLKENLDKPRTPNQSESSEHPVRPKSAPKETLKQIVRNKVKLESKEKIKLREEISIKRPSTPASEISKDIIVKKMEKDFEPLYNTKLSLMIDNKISPTCSSDVSSEAFSCKNNSATTRQIEKRGNSRPSSSSSKTIKTLNSKVKSRPKSRDNWDWEVPDVLEKNQFEYSSRLDEKTLKSKLTNSFIQEKNTVGKTRDEKQVADFVDSKVDVPLQINCQQLVNTGQNTDDKIVKKQQDDYEKKIKKSSRPSTPRVQKNSGFDKTKKLKNDNIDTKMSSNTFSINENSSNFDSLLENSDSSKNKISESPSVCTVIEKIEKSGEPLVDSPVQINCSDNLKQEIQISSNTENADTSTGINQTNSDTSKIISTTFISKLPVLSNSTLTKEK